MAKNIIYHSKQIKTYYSKHRHKWKDFYPSECWVFEKVFSVNKSLGDILDIGCACGGLGVALNERFTLNSYTGVDINKQAVEWASKKIKLSVPVKFMAADIVKLQLNKLYDAVISLSCADWNLETEKIINTCWQRVKDGGYFIISLRLTTASSVNDIRKSYQYINFDTFGDKPQGLSLGTQSRSAEGGKKPGLVALSVNTEDTHKPNIKQTSPDACHRGIRSVDEKEKKPEIANYVVFNFKDALNIFKNLTPKPELIGAYGYWGKPSATAVTPFSKLIFSVFYIKKSSGDFDKEGTRLEINLPIGILF